MVLREITATDGQIEHRRAVFFVIRRIAHQLFAYAVGVLVIKGFFLVRAALVLETAIVGQAFEEVDVNA